MVKRTGPQSLELQTLIRELRKLGSKEKSALWKRVAEDLEKPTRIRRKVNLYKIEKVLRKDETAVVPGKVLSLGEYNKKNSIAAYQFSEGARKKIDKTGKAISIHQLMKENPKGKKVRIVG